MNGLTKPSNSTTQPLSDSSFSAFIKNFDTKDLGLGSAYSLDTKGVYDPVQLDMGNGLAGASLTSQLDNSGVTTDFNNVLNTYDGSKVPSTVTGGETPWYQDGSAMQGYAGLASAATNMALMIPQFKAYKQNLKESKHNLARAREDAKLRDTMRSNINAPTTNVQGVG